MDLLLAPDDLAPPVGRNQHLLARPPVLGIDHEVTDRPLGLVDHDILDMADASVGGFDIIAGHLVGAAELGIAKIAGLHILGVFGGRGRRDRHRPCRNHPAGCRIAKAAIPIGRPAVIAVDVGLHLARHRLVTGKARRVLDLLLVEIDRIFAHIRVRLTKRTWRQQHLATGKPCPGVHDDPSHAEMAFVEQQIVNAADRAILGAKLISGDEGTALHDPVSFLGWSCCAIRPSRMAGGQRPNG